MSATSIVPVSNKAYYISRAVNSVVRHVDGHFELITVDVGLRNSRTRMVSQPNHGAAPTKRRLNMRTGLAAFLGPRPVDRFPSGDGVVRHGTIRSRITYHFRSAVFVPEAGLRLLGKPARGGVFGILPRTVVGRYRMILGVALSKAAAQFAGVANGFWQLEHHASLAFPMGDLLGTGGSAVACDVVGFWVSAKGPSYAEIDLTIADGTATEVVVGLAGGSLKRDDLVLSRALTKRVPVPAPLALAKAAHALRGGSR